MVIVSIVMVIVSIVMVIVSIVMVIVSIVMVIVSIIDSYVIVSAIGIVSTIGSSMKSTTINSTTMKSTTINSTINSTINPTVGVLSIVQTLSIIWCYFRRLVGVCEGAHTYIVVDGVVEGAVKGHRDANNRPKTMPLGKQIFIVVVCVL